jgi:hypothetical protein
MRVQFPRGSRLGPPSQVSKGSSCLGPSSRRIVGYCRRTDPLLEYIVCRIASYVGSHRFDQHLLQTMASNMGPIVAQTKSRGISVSAPFHPLTCAPPPPHPLTHARSTYASSQSLQRLPSRLVRSVFNGGERTIFNGAVALAGLFTCDGAPCYMSPSWGDFHVWRLADVHASVAIADCCDGQSGVEVFQGIAHYSGRSPSCHDVHRHYRQ